MTWYFDWLHTVDLPAFVQCNCSDWSFDRARQRRAPAKHDVDQRRRRGSRLARSRALAVALGFRHSSLGFAACRRTCAAAAFGAVLGAALRERGGNEPRGLKVCKRTARHRCSAARAHMAQQRWPAPYAEPAAKLKSPHRSTSKARPALVAKVCTSATRIDSSRSWQRRAAARWRSEPAHEPRAVDGVFEQHSRLEQSLPC